MEHICQELEKRLNCKRVKNAEKKFWQLKEEWKHIFQAMVDKLVESMLVPSGYRW